jgi:hypothetical protein
MIENYPALVLSFSGHARPGGFMKRKKTTLSLDEVFSKSEKDPKWTAAYEKAAIEVRMAVHIAKARQKARLTRS